MVIRVASPVITGRSMIDKADHIAWVSDAVEVFQKHCGTGDEHAIADLICDLGHLAEERGLSVNTTAAYRTDLEQFGTFVRERDLSDWNTVTHDDLLAFLKK